MSENAIRNRFLELCKHLQDKKQLLQFRIEQFDSEIEQLTVEPGGNNETVQGWHVANFRYRGMIYIERLPGEKLALLALMIRAWLDEHDDTRAKYNLDHPKIETVALGDGLKDVLIAAEFVDEVFVVPTEGGPVEWFGETFDAGVYPVDYAESGEVNGAPV
ncbi:MAG: phage tail protein [Victivallaceae bacterium]|nr:phage tail protein [Victivallaceae bacterium]